MYKDFVGYKQAKLAFLMGLHYFHNDSKPFLEVVKNQSIG